MLVGIEPCWSVQISTSSTCFSFPGILYRHDCKFIPYLFYLFIECDCHTFDQVMNLKCHAFWRSVVVRLCCALSKVKIKRHEYYEWLLTHQILSTCLSWLRVVATKLTWTRLEQEPLTSHNHCLLLTLLCLLWTCDIWWCRSGLNLWLCVQYSSELLH